jgi:hypothetical protein
MVERLQEVDERLGLFFSMPTRCWALTLEWSASDPRRERVQRGELAPNKAYDILCYLPADASADEAYGYLVRSLKAWNGNKAEVDELLRNVARYNVGVRRAILAPTVELADELVEANAKTLFRAEGKHLPRTPAPRSRTDRDGKRLNDFMRDHALDYLLPERLK